MVFGCLDHYRIVPLFIWQRFYSSRECQSAPVSSLSPVCCERELIFLNSSRETRVLHGDRSRMLRRAYPYENEAPHT